MGICLRYGFPCWLPTSRVADRQHLHVGGRVVHDDAGDVHPIPIGAFRGGSVRRVAFERPSGEQAVGGVTIIQNARNPTNNLFFMLFILSSNVYQK
jgi:hypothetical protein